MTSNFINQYQLMCRSFSVATQVPLLYPSVHFTWHDITTVVRKPGIITSPDFPFRYGSGELWCWEILFNSSVTINLILYNVSFNQYQVCSRLNCFFLLVHWHSEYNASERVIYLFFYGLSIYFDIV